MGQKLIDCNGLKVNCYTVIGRAPDYTNKNGSGCTRWLLRCDRCGATRIVTRGLIQRQKAQCGCDGLAYPGQHEQLPPCPYNSGVDCAGGNCERCGWRK